MAIPLTKETLNSFANICNVMTKLPILSNELYVRYDKEADVLYVMFDKDSKVYLSRDGDDDILWEYDINERLVGVTIMDVSMRQAVTSQKM